MLSDTIYFFHDIKNDESKTNMKIKSKFVHHTVKSSLFTMNEIAVSKKIRELNAKNGFKFYIFDKAERLKIAGLGPYSMDASIVKSDAQKILLTFAQNDLIYLDSSLSLSSSKKYIFQLIESYRFLLRSIDLLVCNRLIHNGINFDTILIKNEAPILTNFMFTVDLQGTSAFNWSQYFLERPLDKFCPVEFYLLQYQVTNNQVLSVYNIETIIRQFIKNHGLTSSETDLTYFFKYANKTFNCNIDEALKYCWTWDNYALSMVYLDILKNTFLQKDNKFISYFMKLLVDNICLDPSKRGLPNHSLLVFEEMLQTISINDFRELI